MNIDAPTFRTKGGDLKDSTIHKTNPLCENYPAGKQEKDPRKRKDKPISR